MAAGLFFWQVPEAVGLWPFPGTSPLSNIFLASFFAAAAASTGWVALARRERALAGISVDYLGVFVPFSAFGVIRLSGDGAQGLLGFVVASVIAVGFGAWLWLRVPAHPWLDTRPMPSPVRASFAVFASTLVVAGVLLVLQVPNILPWTVTPDLSTLFGFTFFGAAAYFAYGVRHPVWENAAGQLAGFLAYDVVMIGPFVSRVPTITDELRLSLWVYVAVVVYSALLAAWYLGLDPRTRIWPPRPG